MARAAGATNTTQAVARYLPVPSVLVDVALIDASAAAAAGSMSVSWWHAEVAARRAPQPVIRRPRCTRWRAAEVAAFWRDFGSQDDATTADKVKASATKASAAARVKRSSQAESAGE